MPKRKTVGGKSRSINNIDLEDNLINKFNNREMLLNYINNNINFCNIQIQQLENYKNELVKDRILLGESYLSTRNIADFESSLVIASKINKLNEMQRGINNFREEFINFFYFFIDYNNINEDIRNNTIRELNHVIVELNEYINYNWSRLQEYK